MITNFNEGVRLLLAKDFSVSLNEENEWEHHFEPTNFVKISSLTEKEILRLAENKFFKIAKKTGLQEWDSAATFLEKGFEDIVQFIKISSPACGTGL